MNLGIGGFSDLKETLTGDYGNLVTMEEAVYEFEEQIFAGASI